MFLCLSIVRCNFDVQHINFQNLFKVIINSAWALCLLIDDDQVINIIIK